MPIYEYYCPKCNLKFEVLKGTEERESNPCPQCKESSCLVPSAFHWWFDNPFTRDGEGFVSKYLPKEEVNRMNRAIKER